MDFASPDDGDSDNNSVKVIFNKSKSSHEDNYLSNSDLSSPRCCISASNIAFQHIKCVHTMYSCPYHTNENRKMVMIKTTNRS